MKAAIIGSGMIAHTHLTAMRNTGVDVVGVYSLDKDSAVSFAQKNQIKVYQTMNELLADDIDFAAICTPSGTHCQLAIDLMESGKHAVVEKPIVLTQKDGKRILETEKETGNFVLLFHSFDFLIHTVL